MPFCPNCKKLVYPVKGQMTCKNPACNWTGEAAESGSILRSTAGEGTRKRVILEEKVEARPEQVITCPKCQHNKAYFHLMQTRRSDEPPTQINECVKCGHSWREY
ncbi:MAG: transcription factor [Thermoplasmata archaeon]|nr:transcription factor [Thermoplasmata archaeon]